MKISKKILIYGLVLLAVQAAWYVAVKAQYERTHTKTTATVIRIDSTSSGCIGRTCDNSARRYPRYEYYDNRGHRYVQDDQFFGEYKANNPLGHLFVKKVGAKVPAYYANNNPQEVIFMASPYAYTALLLPLYIVIFVLFLVGIITFFFWIREQSWYSYVFKK